MEELWPKIQEWIALYGLKVIAALLIVLIGRIVAKIVRALLKKTLRKLHIDETLISFISNICYFGIFAFAVIAALGKMGVETASFVVVLGSAGLAIGLALQGSLANFAAGILMIIFKPFKVGDYIEGGGAAGSVEDIGIFTTDLNSPDNKKIIIPNAKLTTDKIVNYSAKEIRRVDIVASVSYHDDLDKVKRVLEDILAKDERVLAEPASVVAVLELGDSSINLVVRPWVKTADYWPVLFSVKENIKKRFDAEGITIPFPQQDVHIHKAD